MAAARHRSVAGDNAERGNPLAVRQGKAGAPASDPLVPSHAHHHRAHVWAGVTLLLAGCSSSVPYSPCADISGNYAASFVRLSGTCDPKLDGDGTGIVAIVRASDGSWSIMYPGLAGACPAMLDSGSCRLTAQCEARASDGSLAASASFDLQFGDAGYRGSVAAGFRPPVSSQACAATYNETAHRL
jgi:hypothetical protein